MSKHSNRLSCASSRSLIYLLSFIFLAAGCSNNYSAPPAPAIGISPATLSFSAISQGAASAPSTITISNSGNAALNLSSVAFGGANVADFTNANNCSASIAYQGSCTISVAFAPKHSGPLSETITLTDNATGSPQVVSVSGTANAIALALTPPASAIGASGSVSFSASGDPNGVTWSLFAAPFLGVPGAVASPGTLTSTGASTASYAGPAGAQSFYATVVATSTTDPTKTASATINVVAPGAFTPTNNVQVAQYTVSLPSPGSASVQFGPDTNYGLSTWSVPNTQSTGALSTPLYVAGMKQSTAYHMRGVLQFTDGTSFTDADNTFTTGALPANLIPTITATTTPGMTPQPGLELLDLITFGSAATKYPLVVTDLNGNILWTYNPVLAAGIFADPIKLLPNGDFLINFNGGSPADGAGSMIQEVDLGGNLVWQMTAAQLNTALAAATCSGCNITVVGTHHDFATLPNGHLIVIAATQQVISGTTVTGDVVIDLGDMENVGGNNPNHSPQPIWLWNEFDHLDINRQPYNYPDWTHTNAVIYSKDDGDLIISIRHQNWLVKIDYNNGAGAGDILWKLGAVLPTDTTPQDTADFALLNADGTPDTNLTDWFFAQHGPSFTTSNTTGSFGLTLFDNGDDRGAAVVPGGTCGVAGQPACYSTVPVFTIDETAKTATLVLHPTTPGYSFFGGNAEILENGNIEYDEAANSMAPGTNAAVFGVTNATSPQTAWQMQITGQYAYRSMRIPSLYPGVQW